MRYLQCITAIIILGSTAPVVAHAQGQTDFGIKGGVSFGKVSNQGLLPGNLSDRTGIAAGVAVGYQAGLIGFGVEGLFAQRGAKSSQTGTGDGFKLDYFDIPAYLRIMLPAPGVKPFVYAGPQVSFELRCKNVDSTCVASSRKKTDFAAVVGAGVRFGDASSFSIEGRYIYGLTDLKLNTVTSADSYKTRSFLILVGYNF